MTRLNKALFMSLLVGTSLSSGLVWAGPEGGVVTGGSATISQSGSVTTINQQSSRALIDWQSFNVGTHENVNFIQNGSSSVAINRIHDANPSTILGSLNATGQVVLINPNGVVFGQNAQVDVGSLVVSTASPTDSNAKDFVDGKTNKLDLSIAGNPDAKIINAGRITARNAGLVGFVAPNVINNGVILANKGSVQLASGDTATLDLYGDGLVNIAVSDAVKQQLIEQNGWIEANGGLVAITAAAGEQIVNSVINMGGVTQAHSIEQRNGKIILKGDNATINVTGKMDVSGKQSGQKGGTVTATAKHINLKAGSLIDASGDTGGGSVKIGGDYKGQGSLKAAQTLTMEKGAAINNDAVTNGEGGQTILWSNDTTYFYGEISGKGGQHGGSGGFVETSGKQNLKATGQVDLSAASGNLGTWLLDPTNITIYGRSQGGTDNVNTVTTAYLEGQGANIVLTADNNIVLDLANDTLAPGANRSITLNATTGNITSNSNGTLQTSGNGAITLNAGNDIVLMHDVDLTATGLGAVTLQANRHIVYSGSADITTNGGAITLNSDRDATNGGAISLGTNTVLLSSGGNITLGGGADPTTTKATGDSTYLRGINLVGVAFDARGVASGGNIIMNGQGWSGTTAGSAHGIYLDGTSIQTNFNGTTTLNGTGGGTGAAVQNIGIYIYNGSTLTGVNGLMSFTGTGGIGNGGTNSGLALSATGINKIQSNGSGHIIITGIGGTGSGLDNNGIILNGASSSGGILSTSGNVTLTGILGSGAGSSILTNGGTSVTIGGGAASGTIALIADTMSYIAAVPTYQTTGDIIIRPYTSGTTVRIGDSGTGTLQITNTLLNNLTYGNTLWLGGYGLSASDVGFWNSAGNLNINMTRTFAKNVNILSGNNITVGAAGGITMTGAANFTLFGGYVDIAQDYDFTATGTGNIDLRSNSSLVFSGSGDITTNGGAIILNADRNADLSGGISLGTGTVVTSNGGNITMGGGTSPTTTKTYGTGSYTQGIKLDGATVDARGTASGGSIIMNGNGYTAGTSTSLTTAAEGIYINNSTVQTNFNGNITMNGTAGGTGTAAYSIGVFLRSDANVSTVNGNLSITGTGGGGSGDHNAGVVLSGTGVNIAQATGSGNITITGSATNTTNGSYGVSVNPSSIVRSAGGNVSLTGSADASIFGIYNIGTVGGASSTGSITLITDRLAAVGSGYNGVFSTAGDIIIRPSTAGKQVFIGAGGSSGNLQLTDTILGQLTWGGTLWLGGYGLTGAETGYWNSSGNTWIDTTRTFTNNVNIVSGGSIGTLNNGTWTLTGSAGTVWSAVSDITSSYDYDITATGSGSVNLRAGRTISNVGSGDITTAGGSITLNADRDATNGGEIYLGSGTELRSNGGNITLGGGADPTTTATVGTTTYSYLYGVRIGGSVINANGTSSGGNISIRGQGWTGDSLANSIYGVLIDNSTVRTNNNGTVTIDGVGGNTNTSRAGNYGINIGNNALVAAVNGAITLSGTGGGGNTSANNHGISFGGTTGSYVQSEGSGNIIAVGRGSTNATTVGNVGIVISNADSGFLSTNGDITLTGIITTSGGSYGFYNNSNAVGTIGGANATGRITIIGDSLSSTWSPTIQTTGDVILRPYTAGTTVRIGDTGTGTMQITNAILDKITWGGTLWLGGYGLTGSETGYWSSSGSLTMNATRSFGNHVNLVSDGNIVTQNAGTMTLTGAANTIWSSKSDINSSYDYDITSTGTGSVTLQANNHINLSGSGDITTTSGAITLNSDRDANGSGAIVLQTGSNMTSTSGAITLGGGTDPTSSYAFGNATYSHGIYLNQSAITTTSGAVNLHGKGYAASNGYGIYFSNSSSLSSGSGHILLEGVGLGASSQGIDITTSTITSTDGNITLRSLGNTGLGIVLWSDVNLYTQNGDIKFEATGTGSDLYVNNTGTKTIGATNATGRITFAIDDLTWSTGGTATVKTGNDILIRPYTNGTTVRLGDSGTGALQITNAMLNALSWGGTLSLGSTTAAGDVNINTTRSFANNVSLFSSGNIVSGGDNTLTVSGAANLLMYAQGNINMTHDLDVNATGTGSVTLRSNNHINYSGSGDITTNGGSITLHSDYNNNNSGTIYLSTGSSLVSNGGNITLGGGADPTTGIAAGTATYQKGISLNGATIDARGTATGGHVILNGQGYASGTGITDSDSAAGIFLATTSILTNNNGTLSLSGTGGGTGAGGRNFGVFVYNGSTLEAVNGVISVTGIGGNGTTGTNMGVALSAIGTNIVRSLGSGNISLNGAASSTAASSNAFYMASSAGGVLSTSGTINIMGISSDINTLALSGGTIGGSNATGAISLTSNKRIQLGNTISTIGNGNITLNAGTWIATTAYGSTVSVNGTISMTAGNGLILDHTANVVSSAGNVIFNSPVTSNVDQTFSAGGTLTAGTINMGSRSLTLTANDVILNGNVSGTGTLTLQPYAANRTVNVNYGTDNGSSFHLSAADISKLMDGWSTINIGRLDGSTDMYIGNSTWSDPITFRNAYRMRGIGAIVGTGNASVSTAGTGNWFNLEGSITTAGQLVDLDTFGAYGGTITTNGGNVIIGGSINASTMTGNGLTVTTAGGDITLSGNGSLYDGSTSAAGKSLVFNAGSGAINIAASVNTAANVTLTGGSITLGGTWGNTIPLGNVSLTSENSIALPSITASSIFVRTTGSAADITLASSRDLISSGSGGITLVAGRNFINQSGSDALQATNGRWLVYSTDTTNTVRDNLTGDFNRYSCSYGSGCASGVSIPASGNGFVYSYTPILTVTPTTKNVTYGDSVNLNGYAYAISGYLGSDISSDTLTGSLNGSTDYVVGNDVGTYGLNYSNGTLSSAMGYGFSYADKANGVNVTPRTLTVSLTGTITKVYDGNDSATLTSGNYVLDNVYNNDTVSLGNITSGTYNDKNVGSGKTVTVGGLFLGGAKAGNYVLASSTVNGNIGTITPKSLVITATMGQGKTYGQVDTALGYTYSGLVGGDTSASFTGGLGRAAGENAGSYAINQGTLAATGNYTISSFVDADYTINKALINITAPNGSRYYGYANPNFNWSNATITGLQNGETGAVLDNLSFHIAGSATSTANAGTTHAIALGSFSDNNYALGSFTGGQLSITKAPLLIAADNKTRIMVMPMPDLTASYYGLRNGENSSVVSGLVLNTTATASSPVGTYVITAGGASAANYNITYGNGTLLVTPGALPNTVVNPTLVVQGAPQPSADAPQINNTLSEDRVPLVYWNKSVDRTVLNTDPLVTFTPALKAWLDIDI